MPKNWKTSLSLCFLCFFAIPAFAALDIVESKSGQNPVWVVKETSSGKTLGTFWNSDNGTSDFGYVGHSDDLTFLWSEDRSYVAVNGGDARSQSVFLYQVTGKTLNPVAVPALSQEEAAPIAALNDLVAEGTDAVRWQSNGTLLLHFWGANRVRSESGEQKTADVWADLEVTDDQAKIVGTSSAEPSAQAGPPPPYPVAAAGETPASTAPGQACSGEQPPDESQPAFDFDKKTYFLRGDEGGIREYLTEGEAFENWNTLISVREFKGMDDPRAYAFKVVENAKASDPNANGQVMENEAAGSYIADFLVFSEKGSEPFFAEWNLMRVEKKGDGLEVVQYARRFYKITESTSKELIAARGKIVPQLAEFQSPE